MKSSTLSCRPRRRRWPPTSPGLCHLAPQAPRKFTPDQLVEQVKRWTAEGLAVYCVQESCGFGFVLHRDLVRAGAQSLLITPVALKGRRKTDKLDARALCLRLSRLPGWQPGGAFAHPRPQPRRTTPPRRHAPPPVPQAGSTLPGQSRSRPGGRVLSSEIAASLVGNAQLEEAFGGARRLAAGRVGETARTDPGAGSTAGGAGGAVVVTDRRSATAQRLGRDHAGDTGCGSVRLEALPYPGAPTGRGPVALAHGPLHAG